MDQYGVAARAASILAGATAWLSRTAAELRDRRRRRVAIRELQRWSDHMLADVGLTRGTIPAAVDGLMRRNADAEANAKPHGHGPRSQAVARPTRHDNAGAAGLSVARKASPQAECC